MPGGPEALPSGIWCCLTKSTRSGDPSLEGLRNVPCPIRSGNRFRSTCVSVFWFGISKKRRGDEGINNLFQWFLEVLIFFTARYSVPLRRYCRHSGKLSHLTFQPSSSPLIFLFISQYSSGFISVMIITREPTVIDFFFFLYLNNFY